MRLTKVIAKPTIPFQELPGATGSACCDAYRLYVLKQDGHVADPPRIMECANDGDAIRLAQQYLDGKALEVW
jgi:hypothetical protein